MSAEPVRADDPDRDVREAICATRDEWDAMDWEMRDWYRWLIRSTDATACPTDPAVSR